MTRIELKSRVGPDGVLNLRVPLGPEEANRDVHVTVEPTQRQSRRADPAESWEDFIKRTYGSCAGLGLEEPEDLPPQQRDWQS